MCDETITFSLNSDVDPEKILMSVYNSLVAKGYNAVNQIAGYILSGDPTYITAYDGARSKMQTIDRHELLKILIESYLIK